MKYIINEFIKRMMDDTNNGVIEWRLDGSIFSDNNSSITVSKHISHGPTDVYTLACAYTNDICDMTTKIALERIIINNVIISPYQVSLYIRGDKIYTIPYIDTLSESNMLCVLFNIIVSNARYIKTLDREYTEIISEYLSKKHNIDD